MSALECSETYLQKTKGQTTSHGTVRYRLHHLLFMHLCPVIYHIPYASKVRRKDDMTLCILECHEILKRCQVFSHLELDFISTGLHRLFSSPSIAQFVPKSDKMRWSTQ